MDKVHILTGRFGKEMSAMSTSAAEKINLTPILLLSGPDAAAGSA